MILKIENATAVNFDEWKGLMTTTTTNVKPGGPTYIAYDELLNEYPVYVDGTKLLRDYAQLSCDYLDKKAISQRGWKSRFDLRNV